MVSQLSVQENLARIRSELASAPNPVTIVGVTKLQPVEKIEQALSAGLYSLANNYAQEGEKLMDHFAGKSIEWHFIGGIQSRKVKYLPAYHCVQSLDRKEIADSLSEKLKSQGKELRVLVEVNVGDEPQKSGVRIAELEQFLSYLSRLPGIRLRGLMGMPPPLEPVEARRPFFRLLRQFYDRYQSEFGFDCLSMGTSADYLIAVEEGSTMVRLGTTLFGARSPKKTG